MDTTNMPDFKKAFENSIVALCEAIGKEGVRVKNLDNILTQDKTELEVLSDILISFPQFRHILLSELNKMNYGTT